jgi:hypothetical protein
LGRFHDEKDRRKCDSKRKIEKHSACNVCSEKDRRICYLKKKIEKMAMECRQVSTLELEDER